MGAFTECYPIGHIGNDVRLPDWLMKMNLSKGAKLTYSVLATCSGGRNLAWPRQEYLAGRVSSSVRSVQRYLGELARNGLIAASREVLKGKLRCVYTFLSPDQETSSGHDKLTPQPVKRLEAPASMPSECRLEGDVLSPPLNKEESIKGKEYIPPTPQTPVPSPALEASADGPGKESVGIEKKGEERPPEDPTWFQIKESLRVKWGESHSKTWLDPLKFELRKDIVFLQAPNPFFLQWLKSNHYADDLCQAFQAAGHEIHFEVGDWLTPKEEKLSPSPPPVAARALQEEVDWSALPLEEQFRKIYEAYPRPGEFWPAFKVFEQYIKRGICPSPGKLLQAVLKQNKTAQWQRDDSQYVPYIKNWLIRRGWLDLTSALLGS